MNNTDRLVRIVRAIEALGDPEIIGKLTFAPSAIVGARIADLLIHGTELAESDIVLRIVDEYGLRRPAPPADRLN